jgi:UDP-N-acetylmuramyl pentapeptide phosphotransferase/UDP-N-acetylglucosamine-1-phosphate transferase
VRELVGLAGIVAATGLVASFATSILIPILARWEVLDRPNERSLHFVPIPRGGGIAVIATLVLAWTVLVVAEAAPPRVLEIVLGAVFLAGVSWVDDLRGLSPPLRLLAQAFAVALGVHVLAPPHSPFQLAAIGLVWLWWINLFNFMDGIDGLAGGEAAAIGAGLLLFSSIGAGVDPALGGLAAAATGAAAGFLVWNWSPARIFLGDVGSVPLGYLLGFLLLELAARGHWMAALILPLYFVADATITLLRRLLRGERVWRAHREHFYQRAVRGGLGHAAVVRRVIVADLLLIGFAWAAGNGWGVAALTASAATVATLLTALARRA